MNIIKKNHIYYRQIIYEYIFQNKNTFKPFFNKYESESDLQYNDRYDKYIENINNDGTFAGNF